MIAVAVTWVICVVMMWRAYHTLPTAAEMADARHVRPPLPFDLYKNIGISLVELLFVMSMLWPGWAKHFVLRAIATAVVLVVWFFTTVPMDLNQMEWLHRRWLALMVLLILAASAIYPFLKRGRNVEAQN